VVNQYLVADLKKLGLWDADMLELLKRNDGGIQQIDRIPAQVRAKYKEVFEIDPKWLVRAAAHRGKWIDQSQSFNVFTRTTSGNALTEIYFLAWNMGLKTTYYLRTLAASGIEKSTLDINKKPDGVVFSAGGDMQESASHISKNVLQPVAELKNEEHASAGDVLGITTPKLCLLDDPTCEACQ